VVSKAGDEWLSLYECRAELQGPLPEYDQDERPTAWPTGRVGSKRTSINDRHG
jgi:hypothetical protein